MTQSIYGLSITSQIKKKENRFGRTISKKPTNGRKNVGDSSKVNVSGDTTKDNNSVLCETTTPFPQWTVMLRPATVQQAAR
jgi:hypothetical protein